jgi:hypothetical protein
MQMIRVATRRKMTLQRKSSCRSTHNRAAPSNCCPSTPRRRLRHAALLHSLVSVKVRDNTLFSNIDHADFKNCKEPSFGCFSQIMSKSVCKTTGYLFLPDSSPFAFLEKCALSLFLWQNRHKRCRHTFDAPFGSAFTFFNFHFLTRGHPCCS